MQEQMILEAIGGSDKACRELYELWFPKAYRAAKAICGSRASAEDAVQEALIRFWRAMPRLRDLTAAEGYFMRTVANEARRIYAQRKDRLHELTDRMPEPVADSAEAEAGSRERARALVAAVDRLPEKLRLAVRLHYFGGFTEAKTAELLGISAASAKMRLSRARARLRQQLEKSGYDYFGG